MSTGADEQRSPPEIRTDRLDAVIFDMDGVITDTASVHAAAWKQMFDRFLTDRPAREGEDQHRFSEQDYYLYVDGKPRYDGVESFLASRGIVLPRGARGDPPAAQTVCGLGNRKDELFLAVLRERGVAPFPSSVELLRRLRASGVGTAIISASRNCAEVLEAAGVAELFDARVDGVDADELGLGGKPDPAVFLEAARRLGVEPPRAAVVEDALAGVQAGRQGEFGLVIGVDRSGHAEALRERGADEVVGDLGEVRVWAANGSDR
jgi:alpha,alpha-trehalase